jgi:uncharacterized protein (DUF2147 family)
MRTKWMAASAALFSGLLSLAAGAADTPAGLWLTESGNAAVEIKDCGAGLLCGQIVWLEEPNDETGKPKTDKKNPSADLKSQKLCGMLMIGNFKAKSPSSYEDGFIYNPEDGKTYSSEMELKADGSLHVRGYVGFPMFGKSQVWTRLPATTPRCKA